MRTTIFIGIVIASIASVSASAAPSVTPASATAASATADKPDAAVAPAPQGGNPSGPLVNGAAVIFEPTLTPEELQRQAALDTAWQERCRPRLETDAEGLARTRYAMPNCDVEAMN